MSDRRQATENQRDLARRLLADEAGGNASSTELAEALLRALDRLDPVLGRLIGPAGYEALLRRALHLARGDWPFFQGVQVETSADDARLARLVANAREQDAGVVREGLVAILANLIWLLVTFVGEAIALKLINRAFPDLSPAPGDARSEGTT